MVPVNGCDEIGWRKDSVIRPTGRQSIACGVERRKADCISVGGYCDGSGYSGRRNNHGCRRVGDLWGHHLRRVTIVIIAVVNLCVRTRGGEDFKAVFDSGSLTILGATTVYGSDKSNDAGNENVAFTIVNAEVVE